MKSLLSFGLIVLFSLVPFGCAHISDNPTDTAEQQQIAAIHGTCPVSLAPVELADMPKQQEIATGQTNGMPRVEIPEAIFDFGLVREGSNYVHAFKIRNTGTGVLQLKKIMPG